MPFYIKKHYMELQFAGGSTSNDLLKIPHLGKKTIENTEQRFWYRGRVLPKKVIF